MTKTYKIGNKEIERLDLTGEEVRRMCDGSAKVADKLIEIMKALNEEKEECKHDWIEYDREKNNTPIDICRNCPTTKQPTSLKEEKLCCASSNSMGLACTKCVEPKSTLKNNISNILYEDQFLLYPQIADEIISLFKDTLLKEIKEIEMPEYQNDGAEHAHAGYVRALEDIINKIKNL